MKDKYKYLIGNEWRESKDVLEVKNPYDNAVVSTTFLATENDIDDAVQAATIAFEETRKLPVFKRAEILDKIKDGIRERSEEFAQMITMEAGKPISDSRAEVERAIGTFQTASEESKRMLGEYIPLDISERSKNRKGIHRRFPIGPILGISPFNFPLNLIAHKVAPAIAAGNPVIIKPSAKTPMTALLLGEVISGAGLPAGGFSVFPCTTNLAERLVADERLRMLTFTGSAAVGWRLKQIAGRKRVTLELGGNAGAIIDSAENLDYIVKRCILSAFSFSGQVCISLQRLFIQEKIYDDFISNFTETIKTLKTGDPRDEDTQLGPMIDEQAAQRIESWVHEATGEGAILLAGGKRKGTFYESTVIANATPQMKVSREELFAPVVTVTKHAAFEEAVKRLNDSVYGLQASVFTNNIRHIFYAYEHLEAGGVIVNDAPSFRTDNMPYGGVKASGIGREGVRYALEEMTESKMLVLNIP
ncbi:MAG: aldehyde dehydrogenase family protein [Candidatus Loosdrechtia sp.]|uniref:aldehyde dehydrogenase family protein n=1 Tax=Candidatus Loosdrechtia sp. TaxID=3101272 RepID=UPI003A5D9F91|nr:MAG: aldehyde dehydrogenase family protein [Candidatus Jettenia sp. AMX2]